MTLYKPGPNVQDKPLAHLVFLHQQFLHTTSCSTYFIATWKLTLNRNNASQTTIPKGNVKGTQELENLTGAMVNPIFEFQCGRYGNYVVAPIEFSRI